MTRHVVRGTARRPRVPLVPEALETPQAAATPPRPKPDTVRWHRPALVLTAVALIAFAGWAWTANGRSVTGRIRLALAPFESVSGEPELGYLVRGIADETRPPRVRAGTRARGG